MKHCKILFVCLGNICRSPSAEAVMNGVIEDAGLEEFIMCDSAGTYGYHAGQNADARMQSHAIKRGYDLTSISRKIIKDDFKDFDYIIAMDNSNYDDLISFAQIAEDRAKIYKIIDFCSTMSPSEVPDPYYGGDAGFEEVLDILEDATNGLLNHLKKGVDNE